MKSKSLLVLGLVAYASLANAGRVSRDSIFTDLDANHDGAVSFAEFYQKLAPPIQDAAANSFNNTDANSDGVITQEEVMSVLDPNKDGVISYDEYYGALSGIYERQSYWNVFDALDLNNDNSLTDKEMLKALTTQLKQLYYKQ